MECVLVVLMALVVIWLMIVILLMRTMNTTLKIVIVIVTVVKIVIRGTHNQLTISLCCGWSRLTCRVQLRTRSAHVPSWVAASAGGASSSTRSGL